jgi:hypothetical protein
VSPQCRILFLFSETSCDAIPFDSQPLDGEGDGDGMSSRTLFFFRLNSTQMEATICQITGKPEMHGYGPAAEGCRRALVEVENPAVRCRGMSSCSFHWRTLRHVIVQHIENSRIALSTHSEMMVNSSRVSL